MTGLILLDCDEVLLNWMPGMDAYVRGLGMNPSPYGPGKFDLTDWLGVDRSRMISLVREFNEGPETGFGMLQPLPGAVEGVAALRNAGYALRIVTTFSDNPNSIRVRQDNLDRVFGPDMFEGMDALPLGTSKLEAFQRHAPGTMIDDLRKNIEAAEQAGHRGILMAAHHNATDIRQAMLDERSYATDWSHLLEIVGLAQDVPQFAVDNP